VESTRLVLPLITFTLFTCFFFVFASALPEAMPKFSKDQLMKNLHPFSESSKYHTWRQELLVELKSQNASFVLMIKEEIMAQERAYGLNEGSDDNDKEEVPPDPNPPMPLEEPTFTEYTPPGNSINISLDTSNAVGVTETSATTEAAHTAGALSLSQEHYLQVILQDYSMEECAAKATSISQESIKALIDTQTTLSTFL
jgi:hypothetical protein